MSFVGGGILELDSLQLWSKDEETVVPQMLLDSNSHCHSPLVMLAGTLGSWSPALPGEPQASYLVTMLYHTAGAVP